MEIGDDFLHWRWFFYSNNNCLRLRWMLLVEMLDWIHNLSYGWTYFIIHSLMMKVSVFTYQLVNVAEGKEEGKESQTFTK